MSDGADTHLAGGVVDEAGLHRLVAALREDGRTVVAPTRCDGVIAPAVIDDADELPIGWADEQDGGHYRLVATGTREHFAHATPSSSWKRHLYPERTLLVRTTRTEDGIEVHQPDPGGTPLAFFGIRACDLAALDRLDAVFLAPGATDPTYAARRRDLFVVAAGCRRPGGTCFCASMGTGPSPVAGFDLAITELHDTTTAVDGAHEFVVEVGTVRGAALLDRVDHRPVTEGHRTAVDDGHQAAAAAMGRHLDPADPPRAGAAPDHPHWDDVARRCLSCANCTMVCPTCFCSATEDTTDLVGDGASRWRVWDSCFTVDFSHLHGGSVRNDTRSRYRQWLLHKLVTWHDQFSMSGCVGCGRCITACPVGIDLTAEIAALARPAPPVDEPGAEP